MNGWNGTTTGVFCITTLVGAGMWYANEPDLQHQPLSFANASVKEAGLPQVAITRVDWSTDGNQLLSLSHGQFNAEGRLALHDFRGASRLSIDAMDDSVGTAALAPDGRHVLVGSNQGRLWWIEPESLEPPTPLIELPRGEFFSATAVANDGRQAAGGTNRGVICLCDPDRQTSVILPAGRRSAVADLRFSRDGRWLACANTGGQVAVWDVATGASWREFAGHGKAATAVEILPDGKRIISASLDDTVRIWDITSGRELWRGEFGLGGVTTLAVSPDGSTAAWGGHARRIIVWDLALRQKRFEISTPASIVFNLRFSADGRSLAAAGREGTIRLYDVRTGIERAGIELDDAHPIVRAGM